MTRTTLHEVLETWAANYQLVDAAVAQSVTQPAERPRLLAKALYTLYPAAVLSGCLLRQKNNDFLSVQDEGGQPLQVGGASLQTLLGHWMEQGQPGKVAEAEVPSDLNMPGQALRIAPVIYRHHRYGVLCLALATDDQSETEAVASTFLTLCAERLAPLLHLEQRPRSGSRAELSRLSNVAEMTSVVTHEFNNFLNGMLLHLALVEQEAPEQLRNQLALIRKLGTNAAAMVKRLQQFNRSVRPPLEPINLTQAVQEIIAGTMPPSGVRIATDFPADAPAVLANPGELERLLRMLLDNASAAVAPDQGQITIGVERKENKVLLKMEDTGPAIAAEMLPRLFEPFVIPRPGIEEPGLAICKSLARRLQASIYGENRPEGGVMFVIEFNVPNQ